ncbi:MAG: CRISPR-associated protein Cas5 [Clostridiales bacterium]|nr:CRISPR-associated protein Cas5 [Clostridiales bacterium]
MDKVLSALLTIPYWCSFRKSHTINVHMTYPVPPITTIYGLIANALGLEQDDYSLMDEMSIGLSIEKWGEEVDNYSNIMKSTRSGPEYYYSTSVIKQKIIKPQYYIYVRANKDLIERIEEALNNPSRLLYFGESDDLVEISRIEVHDVQVVMSKCVDSIIAKPKDIMPVTPGTKIISMPKVFTYETRSPNVINEIYYVNKRVEFEEYVEGFRVGNRVVAL